ncbi:uncharacterized protein [Cicer arietinum]|uniref:uncharacterized protein n=1 Tax=Cicer arietinum TaxID=3827 RepID=UPI00032A6A74
MNEGGFPSYLLILDGKNWERWYASMRLLLESQEVFEIVQDGYEQLGVNSTERQQTTFKDCKKRDCKALFHIQQSVESNKFERISKASTSNEASEILFKYYTCGGKSKKVKLQMLRRQYELLQMEEDEVVEDCFNRVQTQVSKKTSQRDVNHKNGKGKIKWYKKYDSDKETIDSNEEARSSRNHNISENISKNSNVRKKFNKKGIQCYNHKKWGHFVDECRSKNVQREDGEALMIVEDSDSDDVLLMSTTNGEHNNKVIAEGVGNMLIRRRYGNQYFICDVLYVPRMKNNMLSLTQLLEKGYSIKMKHGQIKMFDSAKRLVLKAPLSKNRTFKTTLQTRSSRMMEVKGLDKTLNIREGDVGTQAVQSPTACRTTNQRKAVYRVARA